jgi:uncharacterized membrane protein YphA (DoxX/SURF4 family)
MNVALWIAQALLSLVFLYSGGRKLLPYENYEAYVKTLKTSSAPRDLAKFIGSAEVLGAIGIVLPMALHVAPALSTWAAVGLAMIMLLAIGFHLRNRESISFQLSLFLIAAFVVIGRVLSGA